MTDQALTLKQVAKYLNVTEKTIYNLLYRGELPGFKVGAAWRFKREDIEKWIEESKENANKVRAGTAISQKGDQS